MQPLETRGSVFNRNIIEMALMMENEFGGLSFLCFLAVEGDWLREMELLWN